MQCLLISFEPSVLEQYQRSWVWCWIATQTLDNPSYAQPYQNKQSSTWLTLELEWDTRITLLLLLNQLRSSAWGVRFAATPPAGSIRHLYPHNCDSAFSEVTVTRMLLSSCYILAEICLPTKWDTGPVGTHPDPCSVLGMDHIAQWVRKGKWGSKVQKGNVSLVPPPRSLSVILPNTG